MAIAGLHRHTDHHRLHLGLITMKYSLTKICRSDPRLNAFVNTGTWVGLHDVPRFALEMGFGMSCSITGAGMDLDREVLACIQVLDQQGEIAMFSGLQTPQNRGPECLHCLMQSFACQDPIANF